MTDTTKPNRHGYNPESVDAQIAADRRHHISAKEARMIHALLKGRSK